MTNRRSFGLIIQRIVIIGCVILGMAHIILLGFTYQRQRAVQQLDADRAVLEDNLEQLRDINQEELDTAQADLDALRAENAVLQQSFPELGAPFAIYYRIKDLADQNSIQLSNVDLTDMETLDTVSGVVVRKQYNLVTIGSVDSCLGLIQSIEAAGLDTLSLETIDISPEDDLCAMTVNTLGFPASSE